ncbi:hypothetical protein MRX96_010865 [Rhipicephalus microplus]
MATILVLPTPDSLLQGPTKRENKASRYTSAITVICLACTCAFISAMLMKSTVSVVHNHDLAAGQSREPSLELDAQATKVTAEIAASINLESWRYYRRPDKAHRRRLRNLAKNVAYHHSWGKPPLSRATASSRPVHCTLGALLAGLPNGKSMSAIEGVSGAYVKRRTAPAEAPDWATYLLHLAPASTKGSSDSSTTSMFSFAVSTAFKLLSGQVFSENSEISRTSSEIPSLPGASHDTTA